MKDCILSAEEFRTLREMGIHHPHARVRMRAQGLLRSSQGRTLQEVADEFDVHLNSVEHWWQRWKRIAQQPRSMPCIVVLDNAGIHKGEPMAEKIRQWEQQHLYLYYLPPYSRN